jgi:hypothetical protein
MGEAIDILAGGLVWLVVVMERGYIRTPQLVARSPLEYEVSRVQPWRLGI